MTSTSHNYNHYDFIVIGTGPAGVSAAMTASKSNKRVLILEKEGNVGGVCVNTGTVPSKTLREAVLFLTGYLKRKVFDSPIECQVTPEISMEKLQQRLNAVRLSEHQILEKQLARNNIDLIRGTASFVDSRTVTTTTTEMGTQEFTADRIVIATGSKPRNPADVPFDHKIIVDSTSILSLDTIPKSMIILGGGVIGSEYATIFAALGVKVTLLDKGDQLLKFLDEEISEELKKNFPGGNLHYIGNCGDFAIEKTENSAKVTLSGWISYEAECLFFALGREANTEALNIEKAGVQLSDHRYIEVNELYQSSVPHIYAVGDVIGWPSLAATSIVQGRIAALNGLRIPVENFPRIFPFGIYTIPEISYIGITEEEARNRNYRFVVGRCRYSELPRGQISGEFEGMLKMIVHLDTKEILGVHIFGGGATEIIHTAQIALYYNAKIDLFIDNIFNYPTYSEALKIAALNAYNQIQGRRC